MRKDFKEVKAEVHIEDITAHLLGKPVRGMYRYPGEKTPSIKVYPQSQSFYDYGRGLGGDSIRLWAHVCQVDNWTALQSIKAFYGLESMPNKENIRQKIRQQEEVQKAAKQSEKRSKTEWLRKVDTCKMRIEALDIIQQRSEPFSDAWCMAVNQKQMEEYQLDLLCGFYD